MKKKRRGCHKRQCINGDLGDRAANADLSESWVNGQQLFPRGSQKMNISCQIYVLVFDL